MHQGPTEVDGKSVDPNDPLAEQAANAVHGKIITFKINVYEASHEAKQTHHLDSNISQ